MLDRLTALLTAPIHRMSPLETRQPPPALPDPPWELKVVPLHAATKLTEPTSLYLVPREEIPT